LSSGVQEFFLGRSSKQVELDESEKLLDGQTAHAEEFVEDANEGSR
jgi:hypothetical protein